MAVEKEEASEKPWQRCQENQGKRAKEGRRGQLRQMTAKRQVKRKAGAGPWQEGQSGDRCVGR